MLRTHAVKLLLQFYSSRLSVFLQPAGRRCLMTDGLRLVSSLWCNPGGDFLHKTENKALQTSNPPPAKMWWDELLPRFYILKRASFPSLIYLLIYPPNRKYTWFFSLFFFHLTMSLLGPCHLLSERSGTHLAEDGKVQSQGNYLHKPQGRTEGVFGGVVDKQDKEDVPFCAISVSGPQDRWQIVSLSACKDKYVTEVRTETFRGDDRCAVKSRAPKKPLRRSGAHH